MALSKVDYNSLNVTAAASKALKWNSGANGFETGDVAGALVLLTTATASSSAALTFDSDIDDTYSEYIFRLYDIHPSADGAQLTVNFRDGSTNYDAVKTTTYIFAYHEEDDASTSLGYNTSYDLAQSTAAQPLTHNLDNDNDASLSGYMHLFDPSSTTFVKHFMSRVSLMGHGDPRFSAERSAAGYCNVTAAIDGVQFAMSSGNIDAGVIKMYGVA